MNDSTHELTQSSSSWQTYGFAAMVVAVSTGVCFAMFPFFELTNLVMIYLLGTLIVASRGSKGPAAFSSVFSVLCFDFFFVPPRFTFSVADVQYIFTFVVMFSVAMVISRLTIRLRSEAQEARLGQRTMALVHEFSGQLSQVRGSDDVVRVAVTHLAKNFSSHIVAFMPNSNAQLNVKARSDEAFVTGEKEVAVAQWVYDTGQSAGWGTDALPQSDALFVPIPGTDQTMGVLRVAPHNQTASLGSDERKLLDSFAHQMGMALEVNRLQEQAKKAELEMETERLRSALLSSVSHDFRTPLTAIVGSASTLLQPGMQLDTRQAQALLENIQSEGEHLSRLVQNLLETTRLESGTVNIKKELYPLEEVLGSALQRLDRSLKERIVNVTLPENLPLIPMDGLLIEQLFVNLLENAIRHTPPESPIEISAHADANTVTVAVADEGPGLKNEELELVFEKFYHGRSSSGVGLGLAICRAIMKAHGGKIWVENRPTKGAIFRLTLPRGGLNG